MLIPRTASGANRRKRPPTLIRREGFQNTPLTSPNLACDVCDVDFPEKRTNNGGKIERKYGIDAHIIVEFLFSLEIFAEFDVFSGKFVCVLNLRKMCTGV